MLVSDGSESPRESSPGSRLDAWALDRIGSFLEDHLADNVRLDDLAKLAFVSRFHFARCFRSSTGETPMAYLRRLRIERAKQLLTSGNRPIADIAVEVGFYDQSHFTRQFKRVVGTTPGRYTRCGQPGSARASRGAPSARLELQA